MRMRQIRTPATNMESIIGLFRSNQSTSIQKSLFLLTLDKLNEDEPVNEVIEITVTSDNSIVLDRYPLPKN